MVDFSYTTPSVTPQLLPIGSSTVSYFRAGNGRPMLYLHSAGDGGEWIPFHELLSEHSEVIAPDHPGFGASGNFLELQSMNDLVDHYLRFLDLLELDNVDLVGTSFGGWTAAALAARAPARFRKLVLLAPAGLHLPDNPIANLFTMTPDVLVRSLFHDPAIAASILAAPLSPDDMASAARAMTSLARLARSQHLDDPDLENALAAITASTRVLAAAEDLIVPREHCERYAERIPGAELVVINECGHGLYGERLNEVAAAVTNFVLA